jgi:hypothetical protein
MNRITVVVATIILLSTCSTLSAAIDHLQKEDFPRFAVGILRLYYNIGKGLVDYTKVVALGLPKLPMAIATDIFQVGQKKEPGTYYMTEQEKKQRDMEKRMQERMKKLEKKGTPVPGKGPEFPSLTSIKE